MSNRNTDLFLTNAHLERIQKLDTRLKDSDSPKEKIDLLSELAWELRISQPEKSKEMAIKAIDLAQSGEFSDSPD